MRCGDALLATTVDQVRVRGRARGRGRGRGRARARARVRDVWSSQEALAL